MDFVDPKIRLEDNLSKISLKIDMFIKKNQVYIRLDKFKKKYLCNELSFYIKISKQNKKKQSSSFLHITKNQNIQ